MAKSSSIDQLDDAVEAIMADPESFPRLSPPLAALLRIAADLRDLPRGSFRADLKARLLSQASGAAPEYYGKPLRTEDEIMARLDELSHAQRLDAFHLGTAMADLPDMTMRFLTTLNKCLVGVSRGQTYSHWEIHPAGDELLYLLEGEADVVTLTDDGPVRSPLNTGSIFICPRAHWHRIEPRSPIALLFATPGEGTEAVEPEPQRRRAPADRRSAVAPRSALASHDLGAALRDLPVLRITEATTPAEADAAYRKITDLDECTIGVMAYGGRTPWERHPGGDELLYAIDGEAEVTVLTDDGPVQTVIEAGSVFVCPRGFWHRQDAHRSVTMLFGTPLAGGEVSLAEDPRVAE
jgi:quercetin dioxygenase-like cupin family protein